MRKYFILVLLFTTIVSSAYSSDLASEYTRVMEIFGSDDLEQTRIEALKVLQEAKLQQDYYHLTQLYFVLGYIAENTDDFGNAIIYYLEGSRMGLLSDDVSVKSSVISMHKNLESILTDYKHYDLAKKFIKDGIELSYKYNNEKQIISLTNNLVYVYLQEEKYDEALSTIDSLRSKFNLDQDKIIQLKNKEGTAYLNLGDLEKAASCYQYIISNDPGTDKEMYALSKHNLALISIKKGKFEEAISFLEDVIRYSEEKKLNYRLFRALQELGQTYISLNETHLALEKFLKAEDIIKNSFTNNAETYSVYQLLSTTYEMQGNIKMALHYKETYSEKLEEYIAKQEEITELDKKYNIQLLTDRYYDLLAADQEKKNTERIAKFGISGTAFIFLSIVLMMMYRQRRMKQNLARELYNIELTSDV